MGLLRLLLAISVILFHSDTRGFQFVGGGVAVEAFFIISGFYMSLILDTKYTGINGSYSLFITNRFLKLYPAYWTVLLLAVAMQLVCWLATGSPILVFHHIVHVNMNWPGICFLGFSNLAILGQDLVSFFGLNRITGELYFTTDFMRSYPFLFHFLVIPQGWTLGIELGFYLLAPFLLRRKWWVVVIAMTCSLGLRQYLLNTLKLHYDPWVFRFLPSQLLLFLAGNMAYRLYRWKKLFFESHKGRNTTVLLAAALITVCYSRFAAFSEAKTIYLAVVFLALPFLINTYRSFSADNYLGELSYPVYLCHMLVLQSLSMINSQTGWFRSVPASLLTIPLSLLLAMLINRFVTGPVNRFRQRRVRKPEQKDAGDMQPAL